MLVIAVVGMPLAYAAGLRGFWMFSAAAPLALTAVSGTAVVAAWIGVPWSIAPVLVVTVLASGLLLLLRRRARPEGRLEHRIDPWLVAALALAAVLLSLRVWETIGRPDAISQTFDNIFHLNGIRYVLTTGSASSLTLGGMTSLDASPPFYPAAWHALCALVVQLTGVSIPVAVNAVTLVTAAVVWPLSTVLLARTLFGRSSVVSVSAALIATAIPAFPLLLMHYGVLYPFQLGLAVLPVALAAAARVTGVVPRAEPDGVGWWALVLVGLIPGMSLAHPGAFVAWLALTVPFALLLVVRAWRAASTARRRFGIAAGLLVYLALGAGTILVLRPPLEARGWPLQMGMGQAVGQMLTVSMWYGVSAVAIAVAAVLGIAWALIDRTRPALAALGMYGVAGLLFVTVAALPLSRVRDALTGAWYNNFPRLAAVLAVAMVPLAVYGVLRTLRAVASVPRVTRLRERTPRSARIAIGVVAAASFGVAVQGTHMDAAVVRAQQTYAITPESPLLSADEYELLLRLDGHVPEGVAVAGSAWTGASLAFALADRPVLMPHTLMEISAEIEVINNELDGAVAGSAVCAAAEELNVGFVLDFGGREVHGGQHDMPGLDDLENSSAVVLVDSEGEARLYELVSCG